MRRPNMSRLFKTALLVLSTGTMLSIPWRQALGEEKASPIPKASCGPQDRTEAVQGQTTLAERFSPGPARAYNCNLELIGQFEGEGAAFAFEIFKGDCVYYSTWPKSQLSIPVSSYWMFRILAVQADGLPGEPSHAGCR